MVSEKPKSECCGCRACEQSCPSNAIAMVEDEKGFFYPQINVTLCTQCKICDMVCGFRDNYPNSGDNPSIYAVKHKSEPIRRSSTSGGMFTAISDEILKRDGVIYGVGFDEHLNVCHKRVTTPDARDTLKGSKYVQSDVRDTFRQARQDLNLGKQVLYTGTPCQISSLKMFLKRDYDNLFTVDVVCHGTPSNKMWHEFLDIIEKNCKTEVLGVQFRNKETSWHRPRTKLELKNTTNKRIKGEQSYFQLFNPNYMLMPSCHACKFANFKRPADITIGDFWGIERTRPDFDDDKGVSLVLVNSPRGQELFYTIYPNLIALESTKKNCLQGQLQKPGGKNKKSEEFWKNYFKHGMKYVMIKYTEYSIVRTFFKKAIRKIKRILSFPVQY